MLLGRFLPQCFWAHSWWEYCRDRWSFQFKEDAQEADVVIEAPWWERHNIPAPKTIYKLKEIATLGGDGVWRCNEAGPMVEESELWAEERALAGAMEE